MKYLKMLGVAAMAALALTAIVGAGTASATRLYTGASHVPSGTELVASLEPGTSARLATTAEETVQTCTGSEVKGNTTTTGSATETVKGSVLATGLTFTGCADTVDVEEGGNLEIHWISGTTNGTLTGSGFKVRVDTTLFGGVISCYYSAGTGIDLGTFKGSTTSTGTMDINAIVSKVSPSSFVCPSDTRWIAKYVVTKVGTTNDPALWVEEK